jgi:GDP-4-dehydro-6-deoxy-D-mannose reductase
VLDVGALDPQRDFLDVDDVCAAYALALREAPRLEPGVILNLASGTPRRIGDVLQAVLDAAGVEAKPRTDAGRLRPTDIPVACGDASRARALLGWAPAVPWQQTIQAVVADWTARVQAGDAEATG